MRIFVLKYKIIIAALIVGLVLFAGSPDNFRAANGVTQAEAMLSPGCVQVNQPNYDGLYWDTGFIGENGFGGPFNPGEMIIVSANPPVDYAVPWRIYIITLPPDLIAVERPFPGTISFVIPSSSIRISWGASGGGATWSAQCIVSSSTYIPLVMNGGS